MDEIEAARYINHLGKDDTIVEMNVKEPASTRYYFGEPDNTADIVKFDSLKPALVNHSKFVPITKGLSIDSGIVKFEPHKMPPKSMLKGLSVDSAL
ncbi:hypothetical protein HDV01_004852 [Terramyces sp. JEL0728]|nr:hypothetical protein HDV01_004852 [Terramyces sp. JEL0728]